MTLRLGDIILPVAQVGGGRIVLPASSSTALPADLPPTGELTIEVDGATQRWEVTIDGVERGEDGAGTGQVVVGRMCALTGER